MIILGIETSCDETALALIETKGFGPAFECRVISSLVHSQAELHSAYGGVFPTLAKREHGKNIVPLFHKLMLESAEYLSELSKDKGSAQTLSDSEFAAKMLEFKAEFGGQNPELFSSFEGAKFLQNVPRIDKIAVTEGPGLEPALWVGINFARMIGRLWSIPIMPINHMEGHIVGSLLDPDKPYGVWQSLKPLQFPSLAFLLSGGHTELVTVRDFGDYKIIGKTKDDAVGEAYDKVARLLGLPYPGGPHISMLAKQAEETATQPSTIKLPRPMMHSGDLDFSFSGLKTAVLYAVRAASGPDGKVSDGFKRSLALEFELAVSETLDRKLRLALDQTGAQSVIVGGGVSANSRLQKTFKKACEEYGISLYLPSHHISGDNALMIALAAALDAKTPSRSLKAHGTKSLGIE